MDAHHGSEHDRDRGWIARTALHLPAGLAGGFVLVFVLAPIAVMVASTFQGEHGFTLQAWREVLATETDRVQLWNSIRLAVCATGLATLLGAGHAWLTHRTDLPLAGVLGPLGIAPLVIPPILVAMGFADFADVSGFWSCVMLLGVSYAPFVAVLTARGLRTVDGRLYEAAAIARGRGAAERLLARLVAPEILAGALLAAIFILSEHGVPEFLTVKGKTWHTYAEGIFSRWTRRNTGADPMALASPIVASLPLVALIGVSLAAALRLRARATVRGDLQPLPLRRLRAFRWPALLLPATYLGAGVGVPVVVMARWAAGSTQINEPMSAAKLIASLRAAISQAGDDLVQTVGLGVLTTVLLLAVGVPLARLAARRWRWIEHVSVLPVAVPGILLAIGLVHVFNSRLLTPLYDTFGDFYDSLGIVACAYAARFLPFAVLTLSSATRRIPRELEEVAALSGRSPAARAARIHLPLLAPAMGSAAWLIFVLALRELDIAVVLPSGNGTVVRRLSNVVHFGGEDVGGALALLLLLAAVVLPLLAMLISGRRMRSLS